MDTGIIAYDYRQGVTVLIDPTARKEAELDEVVEHRRCDRSLIYYPIEISIDGICR